MATADRSHATTPPRSAVAALGAAATVLTALVALFAAAAAIAGLAADELYRDNAYTVASWRANDLVTLAAVALLTAAYVLSLRGSRRARLVWLGVLWYMLYNYAFYLFAAAFNDVFLLYAGIVAAAAWALIVALMRTDVHALASRFVATTPVRAISAYLAVAAVGLGGAWIAQSLDFAVAGTVPQLMTDTAASTPVVFALDLTLVVPTMLVAAWLLWQRRAWGYVLAAIVGVKGILYGAVLLAMAAYQSDRGVDDAWSFAPVSAFLLLGCLFVTLALLGNLRSQPDAAADR